MLSDRDYRLAARDFRDPADMMFSLRGSAICALVRAFPVEDRGSSAVVHGKEARLNISVVPAGSDNGALENCMKRPPRSSEERNHALLNSSFVSAVLTM